MSVNKVLIIGRLGAKPEVRNTPGGASVGNFSVATNETWMDKNNQKQERTEWHRVVVWGKLAELCANYLDKGRQVYVEGRLQTRQWQDKDGATKYTTEVVANTVQFLDRAAGAGAGAGMGASDRRGSGAGTWGQTTGAFDSAGPSSTPSLEEPSFTEEDIPF